jgi:outer membrane protein TolC
MEWSKKAELDDVEISLSARAASMREELYDAERKIGLFDKVLIPKARQSIAVVQEAYANGSATILDFLDAQRTLLDLEISLAQQRARRETIAGKIDMLLGGKYTQRALGNSASVQGE